MVPCIQEAKINRQLIIVTHNPNIAVACDAEQIIYCTINKKNNNEIKYISGSIENPTIKKNIVDILEGTEPAFYLRKQKYNIWLTNWNGILNKTFITVLFNNYKNSQIKCYFFSNQVLLYIRIFWLF